VARVSPGRDDLAQADRGSDGRRSSRRISRSLCWHSALCQAPQIQWHRSASRFVGDWESLDARPRQHTFLDGRSDNALSRSPSPLHSSWWRYLRLQGVAVGKGALRAGCIFVSRCSVMAVSRCSISRSASSGSGRFGPVPDRKEALQEIPGTGSLINRGANGRRGQK
jgi:hypothetical protein